MRGELFVVVAGAAARAPRARDALRMPAGGARAVRQSIARARLPPHARPPHARTYLQSGTGLLTYKLNYSISDECPLFPRPTVKMNALIVLNAAQNSRDARRQKCGPGTVSMVIIEK